MRLIERVWHGEDPLTRAARLSLTPLEGAYRAVVAARGWMYDRALIGAKPALIPAISIGNLSVGGTGKTPIAAWIAGELSQRGETPAIVLRGYGGDESLVHARLNPGVPVVTERRRTKGIAVAAGLGATVAVLDDAFQHRAAARSLDIVLVAAEQWTGSVRLLPAGPWREPLGSIRRASLVVITRKVADDARVNHLTTAISEVAPSLPQSVVRFSLGELRKASADLTGEFMPLTAISERAVAAIAGVAQPSAFFRQLSDAGAMVTGFEFPDHHHFSSGDVYRILTALPGGDPIVVCTLKDAVKLAALWPATAPSLWYVSQALEVESGGDALAKILSKPAPTESVIT